MPHYKDGTPAKHGDLVVRFQDYDNSQTLGIITSINETATSCNASAITLAAKQGDNPWFPAGPGPQWTFTLSECLKVDAVKVADPPPPPPPPPEPVDS